MLTYALKVQFSNQGNKKKHQSCIIDLKKKTYTDDNKTAIEIQTDKETHRELEKKINALRQTTKDEKCNFFKMRRNAR